MSQSQQKNVVFFLGEILLDILCCMVKVAYIHLISIYTNPQSHKHYSHSKKGNLPSSICRKLGIGAKKESERIEDRFEKETIQAVKVTLISSVQSSLTLLKLSDFLKSLDG